MKEYVEAELEVIEFDNASSTTETTSACKIVV